MKRHQDVVDTRGLVAARVPARPVGESEWRQVQRDDMEAGRGQPIDRLPPQLAPGRSSMEQHDRNALGRALLLDENPAATRRDQMAAWRRELVAVGGFPKAGGEPKRSDCPNQQRHRTSKAVADQRTILAITRSSFGESPSKMATASHTI